MKLTPVVLAFTATALAAPVAQSSYKDYGSYKDVPVKPPAGGYGSYGDYKNVPATPPAGGNYGKYGSYGSYKRDDLVEAVEEKA